MNAQFFSLLVSRRLGMLVSGPESAHFRPGCFRARWPKHPAKPRNLRASRIAPMAMAFLLLFADVGLANPTAPAVVNGTATFAISGKQLTVTNTPGTIINWAGFSIAKDETTRFNQPSAASVVLNRVTSTDPSSILGTLSSNGRIFLINPNGILFGSGSRIDTQGFLASTLDISDKDFLAGRWRFTGDGGRIEAQGRIDGGSGDVWLLSPDIVQQGGITSQGGQVVLAAGRKVEFSGSGLDGIYFEVQAPTDRAVNLGTVSAGAVGMFAASLSQLGALGASTISREGGRILLKASRDTLVSGSVTAIGTNGKGGSIDILGHQVDVTGSASIDVSGTTGGGNVRIGGSFDVSNAQTYIRGTGIRADATEQGDGGKVILWSDGTIWADLSFSLRSGPRGGNEGFMGVSAKLGATIFLPEPPTTPELSTPCGCNPDNWASPILGTSSIIVPSQPNATVVSVTGFAQTSHLALPWNTLFRFPRPSPIVVAMPTPGTEAP